MNNTIRAYGLLTLFLAMGCEDKKPAPTPAPTPTVATTASARPTATAALSAAAATATADASAGTEAYMANCPTAAKGAKTTLKDVPEGIELTIVGSDEASGTDIRERVKKLIATSKTQATGRHNHGGGGRGRSGHCSVITHDTTVESADVPNGSKVTVKAKAKDEVEWLRRETRDRESAAKAPGGSDMGRNHLGHCPSAVEGATTKVADAKDGVVVTVTATAADAVKQIRERAAHQVEVSKKPEPSAVAHNSDGGGGGSLGRCPIVVQGETTVTAKDVEGGSELTVKPKKATDVPSLQKETKERVASMQKTK